MNDFNGTKQDQLLKARDVATFLNISRSLAYRLIQQGAIPVVRINHSVRVRASDLEAYVSQHYKQQDHLPVGDELSEKQVHCIGRLHRRE